MKINKDNVILDLNEIAREIVNRPEIPKLLRTDFDVSFIAVPSSQDQKLYEVVKFVLDSREFQPSADYRITKLEDLPVTPFIPPLGNNLCGEEE